MLRTLSGTDEEQNILVASMSMKQHRLGHDSSHWGAGGAREPTAAHGDISWRCIQCAYAPVLFVLFAHPTVPVLPSASRSAEVGRTAAERVQAVNRTLAKDAGPLGRRTTVV